MGRAQRQKGQRGENEFSAFLTERLGTVVRRRLGQERDGGHDVEACGVGFQVKRQERSSPHKWLEQAEGDVEAAGLMPAVAWRPSRRGWVVVMDAEHFVKLLRETL